MKGFLSVAGIPLPYSPGMDDGIALVLLGCFFLSAYVLSRSRKFLFQLAKDFMSSRTRTSIFATSTAADMRYLLLLVVQACVLGGVCLFCYFDGTRPGLAGHVPSLALLGVYVGAALVFVFAKWVLYTLLGWIFFDTGRTALWLESYSTLLYYLGFLLFPFALCVVYLDFGLRFTAVAGLFLLLFMKALTFYKWLKLFCGNLDGVLFLILYFCALEIMPCLVLYRSVVQLNNLLIIKN